MEFLLWMIIFILLIGFGFAPVVYIVGAIAVVYFVLVILGKIFMFFAEFFYLIFIELKRADPKIKTEEVKEVKEVKRLPKDGFRGWSARVEEVKEMKRFPKEVKKYNEKVDKITNSTLLLGLLSIVFFSALITAVG